MLSIEYVFDRIFCHIGGASHDRPEGARYAGSEYRTPELLRGKRPSAKAARLPLMVFVTSRPLRQSIRPLTTRLLAWAFVMVVGKSVYLQALLHQRYQLRCRLRLLFWRDLLRQYLDRTLDQNSQHGIGVHADCVGHADCRGKDMQRIGPTGSNALNATDKRLNGWVRAVWHDIIMGTTR